MLSASLWYWGYPVQKNPSSLLSRHIWCFSPYSHFHVCKNISENQGTVKFKNHKNNRSVSLCFSIHYQNPNDKQWHFFQHRKDAAALVSFSIKRALKYIKTYVQYGGCVMKMRHSGLLHIFHLENSIDFTSFPKCRLDFKSVSVPLLLRHEDLQSYTNTCDIWQHTTTLKSL